MASCLVLQRPRPRVPLFLRGYLRERTQAFSALPRILATNRVLDAASQAKTL